MVSIVSKQQELGKSTLLTAEYATSNADLLKLPLLIHQGTIVQAMLDLESTRKLNIYKNSNNKFITELSNHKELMLNVETSAMVLSEPFGSGKTIEILALIVARNVPDRVPIMRNGNSNGSLRFGIEMKVNYTNVIHSNLIIVSTSVLAQWEDAIKKFTDLSVFTITDNKSAIKYKEIYESDKSCLYNIVLVKYEDIVGEIPGMEYRINVVTDVIRFITKDAEWGRVIYDDFDVVTRLSRLSFINANWTIFICATTNNNKSSENASSSDSYSNRLNPALTDYSKDTVLYTNFSITCDKRLVEEALQLPKIIFRRYLCIQNNSELVSLVSIMNDDQTIGDAIAGDAITMAATMMGLSSSSMADIFKKMLHNNYNRYVEAKKIYSYISQIILGPGIGVEYSVEMLKTFEVEMHTMKMSNNIPSSPELVKLLTDQKQRFKTLINRLDRNIKTARDKIRSGQCSLCAMDLNTEGIFITRCCGTVICSICTPKLNFQAVNARGQPHRQIRDDVDASDASDATLLRATCVTCKNILASTDIIFISNLLNIEEMFNGGIVINTDEPGPAPAPHITVNLNSKISVLDSIICGTRVERSTQFTLNITNVIQGDKIIENLADYKRKIVVFCAYEETICNIKKHLTTRGITIYQLTDSQEFNSAELKRFKEGDGILMLNSEKHCAGINIQETTDLIFFHRLSRDSIEAQAIGRAQRFGRTHSLNVHYLTYNK